MNQTMTMLKRGFVLSPHGNIEYWEVGSGKPLVMLHSTPSSCMAFRDVAPLLADEVRVISMSTMGFGQSDRPPEAYTTLHQFAQAVVWLMDGLELGRASVYGLLTGSEIAAEVAASWPERVDQLILDEVFNWNTPSRRAVHERLHRYIPEQPDGSHLLELWRKVGGDRPSVDLKVATQRFMNNLLVNSERGGRGLREHRVGGRRHLRHVPLRDVGRDAENRGADARDAHGRQRARARTPEVPPDDPPLARRAPPPTASPNSGPPRSSPS